MVWRECRACGLIMRKTGIDGVADATNLRRAVMPIRVTLRSRRHSSPKKLVRTTAGIADTVGRNYRHGVIDSYPSITNCLGSMILVIRDVVHGSIRPSQGGNQSQLVELALVTGGWRLGTPFPVSAPSTKSKTAISKER